MKTIANIREALVAGRIELTAHALKRMVERNISKREITETGRNLELIEDYAMINIIRVVYCSVIPQRRGLSICTLHEYRARMSGLLQSMNQMAKNGLIILEGEKTDVYLPSMRKPSSRRTTHSADL